MIVVPTLHPAALLRGTDDDGLSKFEPTVIDDLRKVVRLTRELPRWNESMLTERDATGRPWRLFPTPYEVQHFFERFYAACARCPQAIADGSLSLVVDVETTKDNPVLSRLICVGFGFKAPDEEQAINVPVLCKGGVSYWDAATWEWVRALLRFVLGDVRVPKTFHNKGFDKVVLWAQGMPVAGWTWDTMAAHHVDDGELPHNLAYIASRHLDGRYWKDDVKGDEGFLGVEDYTLRLYNLRDILSTQRLVEPLYRGLRRVPRLWDLYAEELLNIEVMIRASMRGMLVDEERRSSTALDKDGLPVGLGPRLEIQRTQAIEMLRAISGNMAFDPGRPVLIRDLLFNSAKLGLPVVAVSKKTGMAAVNKEAMMMLELIATTPAQRAAIKAIISYRQADKLLGTFVNGLPLHPTTNRLHVQWKLLAVSGRYTSSPNAQNWPKKVKKLFRSPPGWKLVGIDLSQAELRYIAFLANDDDMLRMYREDINVHTVNASLLFKIRCPPEEKDNLNAQTEAYLREAVPRLLGPQHNYDAFPVVAKSKWKPIRTLAKNFVFGSNYGAEAETVYTVLRSKRDPDSNELLFPDILLSEIQALRALWIRQLHPAIPRWWEEVQDATKHAGGFHCPISGRVRWFRGGFKRNEMLNFPIQTGVASWMNRAMIEIQDTYDRETGGAAQIVQQVHDALTVEAPDEYAVRAGEIMREVLSRPFGLPGHADARLPADAALIATHLDKT